MSSRAEQKQQTRERLVAAARKSFAANGFAATGAGDIARAAGFAHGTFYVHFDNKGAVLDVIVAELGDALAARLGAALSRVPADARAAVRAAADAFLGFLEEERELVGCYLERSTAGLSPDELTDGINPPVARLLRQVLGAEAERRGADPGAIDLIVHGLLAMWIRVGLRHLFSAEPSRAPTRDVLAAMTLGAVTAALAAAEEPHA